MTTLMTDPITAQPPKRALAEIVYPESDGKPMADNTKQYEWIVVLKGNIDILFRQREDVFVAGNLFWYAVEGFPEIVNAPDIMVAFGRPKGHRGSYQQWKEGGIAPQVVFEVLSPGNDYDEMIDKCLWYEEYGVQEYYVFNPESQRLTVHLRKHDSLDPFRPGAQFISPMLNIRFDLSGPEMKVFHPDGRMFLNFEQLEAERQREVELRREVEKQLDAKQQQLDAKQQQLDEATRRADRLAELSRKALSGQASGEELQELNQLLGLSSS